MTLYIDYNIIIIIILYVVSTLQHRYCIHREELDYTQS